MEIKKGQIYRHFKGDLTKIVGIAKHSDKQKYPNATQEYRFELVSQETL